jgi:tRNA nucleotidyltransferase/poly(A) polymerase
MLTTPESSHPMYLVGGAVHDSLMDIVPHDYDYVVVADTFDIVKEVVRSLKATIVHEDPSYGIVRAKINTEVVDFVIARCDGVYTTKRHCTPVSAGTLAQDLARRDFTVNSIAVSTSTDEVVDPFGGIDDLSTRTLRCVGFVSDRLSEDPLRIIRALRFIVTHGMSPDSALEACLQDATLVDQISHISADRIRQELTKCLQHDTTRCMQVLLQYPLIMKAVLKQVQLKFVTLRKA